VSGTTTPANKGLFKSPFPQGRKLVPLETPTIKDISLEETTPHAAATSINGNVHQTDDKENIPFNSSVPPARASLKQDFSSGHGIPQPQPVEEKKIAWQDISMLVTAPGKAIKRIASRGRPVRHTGNARRLVKKAKARRLSKKMRIVLILTLLCILTPSIILTVSFGVNLYIIYNYATKGVQHLQQVQATFSDVKSHPNELVDPNKLHTAQKELVAAQGDFQRLHMMLESDAFINTSSAVIPVFNPQIASARSLSQIGVDASQVGAKVMKTMLMLSPSLTSKALANTSKPLITPAMYALIMKTVAEILPDLNDIQVQTQSLYPDSLPLTASQHALLLQVIQVLPQVQTIFTQIYNLRDGLGWFLGVGTPHTFLVETMDRAELRPTGGFTGQFGELLTNGGRITPPSLKNVGPLEENNPNSPVNGALAPTPYRSWWPIPNWGLRDSNLSADFPTSAQIIMRQYHFEFKHQLDGIMMFTPFAIEHILQITGPIKLTAYHETITAQNLEQRLHYYQLDNAGIRREEIVSHVEDPQEARKLFTGQLASLLISQVTHAPPSELAAIAREMFFDLQTKDVEIYLANPQLEQYLIQNGEAALIDRSAAHDGLYVVQANVSASKASQYVQTIIHDTVSLNATGGATHVMQLRLVYAQVGPVYGLDTYRDYVRIYVPSRSRFLWGDGFDTGTPFCGAGYGSCPTYNAYGNGDLLCPAGQFEPGAATTMLGDPYAGRNHPLDTLGPPTNFASDEPGRAMFGGWAVVPKNCALTITLSWYVPRMGHEPYSLLVQRQPATFPDLDLTILPTPGDCAALKTQGMHFEGVLSGVDPTFTVTTFDPKTRNGASCYLQPHI
jgi:hypothetical protein